MIRFVLVAAAVTLAVSSLAVAANAKTVLVIKLAGQYQTQDGMTMCRYSNGQEILSVDNCISQVRVVLDKRIAG